MHSWLHSSINPVVQTIRPVIPSVNWFIHMSFYPFFTHSWIYPLIHPLIPHALTHPFIHPFIRALIHPSVDSTSHPLVHSFIHSSVHHPSIHPSIHQCYHSSIRPSFILSWWMTVAKATDREQTQRLRRQSNNWRSLCVIQHHKYEKIKAGKSVSSAARWGGVPCRMLGGGGVDGTHDLPWCLCVEVWKQEATVGTRI